MKKLQDSAAAEDIVPLSTTPGHATIVADLEDPRTTAAIVITDKFEPGGVNIEVWCNGLGNACRFGTMLAASLEFFARRFHDGNMARAVAHVLEHAADDRDIKERHPTPIHPPGRA